MPFTEIGELRDIPAKKRFDERKEGHCYSFSARRTVSQKRMFLMNAIFRLKHGVRHFMVKHRKSTRVVFIRVNDDA